MRKATIVAILGNKNKFADIARHEEETMVKERIESLSWLRKRVEEADTDLLREMVKEMAQMLMSAEADSICGAEYGERNPDRVNQRNGYRTRRGAAVLAQPTSGSLNCAKGVVFPPGCLRPVGEQNAH